MIKSGLVFQDGFIFAMFGFLTGEVKIVGSDSVEDGDSPAYYPVKIKPFGSESSTGQKLSLVAGMEAQVDVITGKRTILSYVTAPITATLQEAFTEQ